ncbi:MAG: hypothetical protein IPL79_12070 [Myxococcales bacterium]|nr:hypothetical protein [Myxococcales bacterium]
MKQIRATVLTLGVVMLGLAPPATAEELDRTRAPVAAAPGSDEKGAFGVGLILGEPTGLSARLYLANDAALQASVGAAFVGRGVQATLDYVIHPWVLENHASFVLPAYVGFGARVIQYRDRGDADAEVRTFAVGARAVAGLLFDFRELPLDAFVEAAGVAELELGDGVHAGLGLNIGLGARYYF